MVIRRIEPFSFARVGAALFGVLGLMAALALIFASLLSAGGELWAAPDAKTEAYTLLGLLGLPLQAMLFGYCSAFFAAAFYNWTARHLGGVRIDLGPPPPPVERSSPETKPAGDASPAVRDAVASRG